MKNSNRIHVPQAREAMDRFKMLIKQIRSASTCGGTYNASLTSREAGSVGSQLVKKNPHKNEI